MKSSLKIIGLFFILFSSINSVSAEVVPDLYSAKSAIVNQSEQQRLQVIKALFSQVIIKVSGNRQAIDNPEIKIALNNAMSFTSGFNFNRIHNRLFLSAKFNEKLVDELLKSAGLSIWGQRRPSVMLWLGFEQELQRQVLNENSEQQMITLVQQQAKLRGIPLLLPIWDLEDQLQVKIMDIWGLFAENIAQANKRYQTDFVTVAKVFQSGISYRMSWVIYQINENEEQVATIFGSGSDEFATQALALTAIIDQSTDHFSRQFSVNTQTESIEVEFDVVDIDTIENYVAVTQYLESLKAIEYLQLVGVLAGKYKFVAKILGQEKSLFDTIKLEKKLLNDNHYISNQMIQFRWHQSKRLNFALDELD